MTALESIDRDIAACAKAIASLRQALERGPNVWAAATLRALEPIPVKLAAERQAFLRAAA